MRKFKASAFRLMYLFLIGYGISGLCACNECNFKERCRGDIKQVCGSGPDQMFGRTIHDFPCLTPNPVCIETKDQKAFCVMSKEARCDTNFASRCDSNLLINCLGTYEQAVDCLLWGPDCIASDPDLNIPSARCLALPLTPCSLDYKSHCHKQSLKTCRDGFVEIHDCQALTPNGQCVEDTGYGYCTES